MLSVLLSSMYYYSLLTTYLVIFSNNLSYFKKQTKGRMRSEEVRGCKQNTSMHLELIFKAWFIFCFVKHVVYAMTPSVLTIKKDISEDHVIAFKQEGALTVHSWQVSWVKLSHLKTRHALTYNCLKIHFLPHSMSTGVNVSV